MSIRIRAVASTALVLVLTGCAVTSSGSDGGAARPAADREPQSAPEASYRLRSAPLLVSSTR